MSESAPELITRAVFISQNHLLCVHRKGASNIFLPGGHIDPGESAQESLIREIQEELGIDCTSLECISTVEHSYTRAGEKIFEINLLFSVGLPGLNISETVPSKESHIEFCWVPCTFDALKTANLQPWILQVQLPQYNKSGSISPFMSTAYLQDPSNRG